jgi:organic radical activating enzyme
MFWPLTRRWRKKAREGVSVEAFEGISTAQTSASDISFAGGEPELHQTRREFLDELDAHVEQERRHWLEEVA